LSAAGSGTGTITGMGAGMGTGSAVFPSFSMSGGKGTIPHPPNSAIFPQSNTLKEVEHIRTDFSETWLWLNQTAR